MPGDRRRDSWASFEETGYLLFQTRILAVWQLRILRTDTAVSLLQVFRPLISRSPAKYAPAREH